MHKILLQIRNFHWMWVYHSAWYCGAKYIMILKIEGQTLAQSLKIWDLNPIMNYSFEEIEN